MEEFQHKCCECDKVFTSSSNLNRHIRLKHSENISLSNYSEILCPVCKMVCISRKNLEKHMTQQHEVKLEKENLEFSSMDEFSKWKARTEIENNVMFVKTRGTKTTRDAKVSYYYCHRTGHYTSRGKGIRNLKLQGSNKINSFCPAIIKATEKDVKIFVEYTKTHLGHTNDHFRLKNITAEDDLIVEDYLIIKEELIVEDDPTADER